jgi:S1-C subfamily serine protease
MRDPFFKRLFFTTIAAILLIQLWRGEFDPAALMGLQTGVEPRAIAARGELAADEKSTIELFERTRDSVVYITTKREVMNFWTRDVYSVPRGTGSGFIWDGSGHVVTNFHVIENASEATVKLADGRSFKASLVGVSKLHDLAVLKIGVGFQRPPPVPVGTSHDLKVGQKVFAIGNPFGLDWTLTTGIVSALDRSLSESGDASVDHLIQTDAAINPGNSGGPLLDSAGRLIGINTAIYSPSGASAGIGFAVPVDTVNRIVPKLISQGRYIRPSLGIRLNEELNNRLTKAFGVTGVIVLSEKGSRPPDGDGLLRPAFRDRDGNISIGDIIVGLNGKPVTRVRDLLAQLDDLTIGQNVIVSVLRQNKTVDLAVTLQPEK